MGTYYTTEARTPTRTTALVNVNLLPYQLCSQLCLVYGHVLDCGDRYHTRVRLCALMKIPSRRPAGEVADYHYGQVATVISGPGTFYRFAAGQDPDLQGALRKGTWSVTLTGSEPDASSTRTVRTRGWKSRAACPVPGAQARPKKQIKYDPAQSLVPPSLLTLSLPSATTLQTASLVVVFVFTRSGPFGSHPSIPRPTHHHYRAFPWL